MPSSKHIICNLKCYFKLIAEQKHTMKENLRIPKWDAINKEKTDSVLWMLSVKLLSLGIRRNGGKVAEVVIFAAAGDGFQVFCISAVGDADTGNLALFCHIHRLLFFYNRIIGKLIPGDPAALFTRPTIRIALEFACGI